MDHRPDAEARQVLPDILEQAHSVPGVESATLTTGVPLTFILNNSRFVPEESAADPKRPRIGADIFGIGPRFFETMGMSFLVGDMLRFDHGDTGGIAIVNEAFVRAAFPDQSDPRQSSGQALGRRIVGDGKRLQIVGVVATAKSRTIGETPRPSIYLPILHAYSGAETRRGVTLVVKTRDAAAGFAGPMREAIRRADSSLAVLDVRTKERHLSDALLVPRLAGALSTIAGCIGLALATIGVYGVISFAVAQRRREIGIRLAVGTRPREVLAMILTQGMTLAFIGTVLGVLAGLSVTRFAASLLYGVNPTDTFTFVAVPVLLTSVALLARLPPARAAARLDPVDVLRSE
jgi:macrolide transport system ATP-binding/permease protein